MKNIFISILFFFFCFTVLSEDDTSRNVFIYKEEIPYVRFHFCDSDLTIFHQYKPAYKDFYLYNGIGFSPVYSLYNYSNNFPFWVNQITPYFKNVFHTYGKTYKPYTSLTFISNTTKLYNEEYLKAVHSQNINPFINIYFEGLTTQHKGIIPNQEIRMYYLYGSTNFNLPLLKLNAFYLHSINKTKECGGISNITEIIDSLYPMQNSIPFLNRALNKWQANVANLNSYIFFKKDTLQTNSRFALFLNVNNDLFRKIYNDIPSSFYRYIFIDSTKTYDSLSYNNTTCKIGPSVVNNKIQFSINYISKNTKWFNNIEKYNTYSNGIGASLNYSSNFKIITDFMYFFDGYYSKNYEGSFAFLKKINDFNISFASKVLKNEPDFFYKKIYLNNFKWDNNLNKQYFYFVTLNLCDSSKRYNISPFFNYFINFYFIDSLCNIQSESFYNTGLKLSKTFKVKNLYLLVNVLTQSNNSKSIKIPTIATYSAIYYQNKSFNKVLTYQIGLDAYFFNSFNSPQYMPSIGTFVYCYTNIGSYPLINFFINMKLKRARFFILVEHINYLMTKGNFCFLPYYPLPPRTFKFGINWKFFD